LVLAQTHSPARAGLVGFAQTLPYLLFYLPAGALVDRWNRKHVMLVADAGRAVALGSLGLALALHTFLLAQILAVAFVEGSLFVFFSLSEAAALPQSCRGSCSRPRSPRTRPASREPTSSVSPSAERCSGSAGYCPSLRMQ